MHVHFSRDVFETREAGQTLGSWSVVYAARVNGLFAEVTVETYAIVQYILYYKACQLDTYLDRIPVNKTRLTCSQ